MSSRTKSLASQGQPLAEVFGHLTTDFTEKAARYRSHRLCPFNNKVPNCTKDKAKNPLGVCSIYHEHRPVITCPIRFREDWIITDDAAGFFFEEAATWSSLTEVRLNDLHGKSAGNIDVVLVAYDDKGKVYDFAALEIQAVAVIKVHLEKFACKIYRDTRTASHDGGVDLATNFGVVYQIKKLKILTESAAKSIYSELKMNFDSERLQSGNVILVIDDISKAVKQYLISMKVQAISKDDLLKLAAQFEDMEDRQKVLRIVYEEFRREYSSRIR